MSKRPVVAIVGRMNVGKSTLFNRLSKSVKSLTLDYEGVTRDTLHDVVVWNDRAFELVDTGGIVTKPGDDRIAKQVTERALRAVESADLIMLVVDGTIGIVAEDRAIANVLHKLGKKVLLVVNKADVALTREHEHEFQRLGHGEPLLISAQHGTGIGELLDNVVAGLPATGGTATPEPARYRIMFLGKPNVGKSSLMNAITQQERSIVSEQPGTTREPISEKIQFYQEELELIDTPGIRRKRSVEEGLEEMMAKTALRTIKQSDIVLLLIDGSSGALVDQELKLGFYAFQEHHKALILVINKEDQATEESRASLQTVFDQYQHLLKKIPTISISCKTGKNIGKVLPLIRRIWERAHQELDQEELNTLLVSNLEQKPLMHQGNKLILYRARQVGVLPLTIGLKVNKSAWFGPSQLAFFENLMRDHYDLVGVPIKFELKGRNDR